MYIFLYLYLITHDLLDDLQVLDDEYRQVHEGVGAPQLLILHFPVHLVVEVERVLLLPQALGAAERVVAQRPFGGLAIFPEWRPSTVMCADRRQ